MEATLSEEERIEVHEALMLRVEQTKKAKKTCEEAGFRAGVREGEERLRLLRGQDGEPGLLSKFVDQTTLDFNGGKSEPREDTDEDDLFEGADRSTKPPKRERKSRTKASAAVATVNEADRAAEPGEPVEADFEVQETPPPKADEVTSLVPS
jgi:hypothetical protein